MKKYSILIILLLCFSLNAQVINNTSMSAEWSRTANRNAATDAADILVYNPAGLTGLKNGLHINFGNQALLRMPEHTFDNAGIKNFQQESPDYFVPELFCAYRFSRFAVYAGLYIVGGGASADYDTGSLTTSLYQTAFPAMGGVVPGVNAGDTFANPQLKATSFLLATQAGVSMDIVQQISVSAGIRYVYGYTRIKMEGDQVPLVGTATAVSGDAELTAGGIGGVLSICIKPVEQLTIALRFDTSVKLEYETSVKTATLPVFGSLFVDGAKSNQDLPAVLAAGVAWDFGKLRLEANFTWFFQSSADWGGSNADWAGDCYNLGMSASYRISPTFELSAGYVYTKYLWEDMDAYYSSVVGSVEAPSMENHYFAAGFGWHLRENLKLNFGLGMTVYPDKTVTIDGNSLLPGLGLGSYSVKLENRAFTVALGLDWRILL